MGLQQQTGTQQLEPHPPQPEPQPPLDPPQEPQPPLEPPQEPQPPLDPPQEHSPPCSLHRSHSPPWSPQKSHSPLCHSWSRNRLAHGSTRACSSRRAHSSWSQNLHSQSHSPHSRSHSPHSRSHSPHSWSHSLRSSRNSPWFWWIEGGAGRGAGEREVQVWSSLSLDPLYPCPGSCVRLGTHFLVPVCAIFRAPFSCFL
uniref:Uncharacterized protein n=1 Tax=Homo sapiens TaxID=9606 RepID=Q6YL49_HUMAN|nr:unknown [Homo sapiens]